MATVIFQRGLGSAAMVLLHIYIDYREYYATIVINGFFNHLKK